MGWVRNDDDMLDHEKWRRAIRLGGDGVLLMWTRFASWSSRRLTDGEVPADMVDEVSEVRGGKSRARALQALLDAKLLAWCAPDECSLSLRRGAAEPRSRPRAHGDRLVIVGYLQRQPTRASVIAERDRRAKGQQHQRDKRNVPGSRSDYDPSTVQTALPDRDNVPSRPVPSRLLEGSKSMSDPPVADRDAIAPPPPSEPPDSDGPAVPPEGPAKRRAAPPVATESRPLASPVASHVAPPELAEVRAVFCEWQRAHGHPGAKLDRPRVARIRGALKHHTAEQLGQAIRGALKDDWLMCRDPKSPRKYDGLETILRDTAQIERLIELEASKAPPVKRTSTNGSLQPDAGRTGNEHFRGIRV